MKKLAFKKGLKNKMWQISFFGLAILLIFLVVLFSVYNIVFILRNINKAFISENSGEIKKTSFNLEKFESLNLKR